MILFEDLSDLMELGNLNPEDTPVIFCGIYDGHGGENAANYTRCQLHVNIIRNENFPSDVKKAIYEGFLKTDRDFCKKALKIGDRSGCTATIVMILGKKLFAANVGDSSAIISVGENRTPTSLTIDHKASNEDEKKRVKENGGIVIWFSGGWRVNGTMAVSRSIGDEPIANLVIAEPHIMERNLTEEDAFIVIATDGLWDVMNESEVVDFIYNYERETPRSSSRDVSEALTEEAKKRNTADNITVTVVFLNYRSGQ